MSTQNYEDLAHLVRYLHHEYNHDLAHHLLHSKSDKKTKRGWTAWPLPLPLVPLPKTNFKMPSDPLRSELDALFQRTAKSQLIGMSEEITDDDDTFHLTHQLISHILEDLDRILHLVAINRANQGNENRRVRMGLLGWRDILGIASSVIPTQVVCTVEKKCIGQFGGTLLSENDTLTKFQYVHFNKLF